MTWKAGDPVQWHRYGNLHRGTIVKEPTGDIAIIRDHESGKRTWAALESLSRPA